MPQRKSCLHYAKKNNPGFTLIELVIALTLLCVLLLISIPFTQTLITRSRSTTLVNQLIAAIHYARNQAIQLNTTITFCGSNNQQTCDGGWTRGQLVINERTQQILRVYPAVHKNASLQWHSNFGEKNILQFTALGFTAGQNGSFYYCPEGKKLTYARAIIIEKSGQLRVSTTGTRDNPLTCKID